MELPKWFDGTEYDFKDAVNVRNPFTGQEYPLNAKELSMYDYILGCEALKLYKPMQKGLDWFRKANCEAYMVLLD